MGMSFDGLPMQSGIRQGLSPFPPSVCYSGGFPPSTSGVILTLEHAARLHATTLQSQSSILECGLSLEPVSSSDSEDEGEGESEEAAKAEPMRLTSAGGAPLAVQEQRRDDADDLEEWGRGSVEERFRRGRATKGRGPRPGSGAALPLIHSSFTAHSQLIHSYHSQHPFTALFARSRW